MPKIYINGRFYSQDITGVQRYSRELLRSLDGLLSTPEYAQVQVVCLVPRDAVDIPVFQNIEVRQVGMLRGNLWEQIELPKHTRDGILFSPANIGPAFSRNQVLTIHDASVYVFPEAYSWLFRLKYKLLFSIYAHKANWVITDSAFSKSELVRICHFDPQRLSVVFPGYEHFAQANPDQAILDRLGLAKGDYFLAVGSLSPHKNFKVIQQAMTHLGEQEIKLVVTGGKFSRVFKDRALEFPQNILLTGYVSDAELAALYMNAKALILPSLYEGFGFPILEGLVMGCPVIASNAASLPEVGGDVVTYFDPHDPAALAEILQQDSFPYDAEAVQAQLMKFSWAETASKVLEILINQL
ncbi:MAG: glycosyltransferase family 4 protein [Anaerolineaceae bacterium]|nr:glycosyltransferase family 4 protein [Anaerolineaceae bacterium]